MKEEERERKIVERGEGGTDEEGKVRERRECGKSGGEENIFCL